MQGKVKERWIQLREQAAVERDSERLIELVQAINTMLEELEEKKKNACNANEMLRNQHAEFPAANCGL